MSYSGEYITVTDATQEALDLKANLSGNQFTETQYFKGHIVMNGDNNGDRLILTSNIINPSDTDLILNGVEGNNVRAKLQGAFGAPVGQFQIDNGDCNILSSQNKYLINGVDVIGNLETQLQTEIQTGLSGKANLSGGNTFTGQQIMADLELNGLNVKGSLILYEPDSSIFTRKISAIDGPQTNLDVNGNMNLINNQGQSFVHEYKINGTNILDPYRTSADTDTLLNLKAPINDSNLTGHTIMTRLTVNHSDSGTIGLDFNNTNVNQYAGAFNTAGYGWRFYNDNLSQVNNITFGVYTKGTGSQLNPLLIKNDGKLYTLDQEVDGDVNLSAGHEYKINGTSLKNVVETVTNKTIDANNNTINNIKNAINNNDLTIAQTNGLQTELDEKQIRYLPCLIEHAEPSGTDGGTAVATSWNDIVLNTIDDTLRTDYTIGSNQITIATVGTYEISFSVASYSTLGTKGQVIGVTDVGKIINGTSFTTTNASGGMSNGMGVITTTQANEVFKLRVYCGGAGLLGKAVGSGISETYAQVFIKRLS